MNSLYEINNINKKRCIVAFIVSVLIVIFSFIGIIISMLLPMSENVPLVGISNFRYFTILSNLFMNVCACLCIPFEVDGIRNQNYHLPRWIVDVLYLGVVNMAITFFACLLVIAPVKGYVNTFFIDAYPYVHIICPILSMLLFFFINVDHKIKTNRIFISTMPILIYSIVYIFNVYLIGEENGGWFDHYYVKDNFALWQIIIIAAITTIVVSSILLLIHNSQHKKYKNKINNCIRNNKGLDIVEDIRKLAYEHRKQYKEGDIIIPMHIIDIMYEEYKNVYSKKDLYNKYLNYFFDND